MLASILAVAAQAVVVATPATPTPVSAPINNQANALFDRDAALREWALRTYDANRDGWLTLYEAQPALLAFKQLADGDRDGRVTTYEYERAKEFIAARK